MKQLIGNVLNGTIGFLETIRDQSREFVEKGEKNNGPFAKVIHKAFGQEWDSGQKMATPWIEKTLHAMNIATKDDLEALRREWDRKNTPGKDGKP
ncbi:MAG: hypothetical protein M1297_00950 [Nitrospirae bacterium]|jgi:hypothetical protein|nr:hypothetical protein [Nitrospirota bacterium]MDA8150401.1 hypothetical protein [Nitrospiraceae bacterium]